MCNLNNIFLKISLYNVTFNFILLFVPIFYAQNKHILINYIRVLIYSFNILQSLSSTFELSIELNVSSPTKISRVFLRQVLLFLRGSKACFCSSILGSTSILSVHLFIANPLSVFSLLPFNTQATSQHPTLATQAHLDYQAYSLCQSDHRFLISNPSSIHSLSDVIFPLSNLYSGLHIHFCIYQPPVSF